MCGRLACGLKPDEICNISLYKNAGSDDYLKPQWKDIHNCGKTYMPSYNICPTELAPVLLSGVHFQSVSRVVVPMVFGLIPQWTKADEINKYSTINCRIETVKTSKLYSRLLQKGQRCVVICNGFFEWQKQNKNTKKPYFVHCAQSKGVFVCDPNTWNSGNPQNGGACLKPLRLAALFDINTSGKGEDLTFSFTVITKKANSEMSWLHERMPLNIETEEELEVWLNNENYDGNQAINSLSQKDNFISYPVSNFVNKPLNKDIFCIKQNSVSDKMRNNSGALLKRWFNKKREIRDDKSKEVIPEKISKKKENN